MSYRKVLRNYGFVQFYLMHKLLFWHIFWDGRLDKRDPVLELPSRHIFRDHRLVQCHAVFKLPGRHIFGYSRLVQCYPLFHLPSRLVLHSVCSTHCKYVSVLFCWHVFDWNWSAKQHHVLKVWNGDLLYRARSHSIGHMSNLFCRNLLDRVWTSG